MLQASEPWLPLQDGDRSGPTLVNVAERAVRDSTEWGERDAVFDESNGLFIVLAGSLISNLLSQAGKLIRVGITRRSSTTTLPAWIRNETWTSEEGR